jgi:hypothetical protein
MFSAPWCLSYLAGKNNRKEGISQIKKLEQSGSPELSLPFSFFLSNSLISNSLITAFTLSAGSLP